MRTTVLLLEEAPRPAYACDLAQVLAAAGFDVRFERCDVPRAPGSAAPRGDVVLACLSAERAGGSTLPAWLQAHDKSSPVLAVLPESHDWPDARRLLSRADDFLVAPVRRDEILARLERLMHRRPHVDEVTTRLAREHTERQLIGSSSVFAAAIERARVIAAAELPVLISGETGTGKELFARAIHHLGRRHDRPFVPVDCGAMPEYLFENELFGHERGAFTDAVGRQDGLAALAERGTLFLDEVNSLSPAHQAKLLRFLQDRTYRPLGGKTYRSADVRIIAATNRDLAQCVRDGQFREDLYFRLHVLDLMLPPLRQRRADIPVLARHFLAELGSGLDFSADALQALTAHDWRGNVRELYNRVVRAAAFCSRHEIGPDDLGVATPAVPAASSASFREARAKALGEFEREYVQALLNEVGGNITQAARRAGKGRRTIGRLVQKHRLNVYR